MLVSVVDSLTQICLSHSASVGSFNRSEGLLRRGVFYPVIPKEAHRAPERSRERTKHIPARRNIGSERLLKNIQEFTEYRRPVPPRHKASPAAMVDSKPLQDLDQPCPLVLMQP